MLIQVSYRATAVEVYFSDKHMKKQKLCFGVIYEFSKF